MEKKYDIKAIIGLGNPGPKYYFTRHSIGFLVVDALAMDFGAQWQKKDVLELAEINCSGQKIILIKPQTFMNSSGKVIPFLLKKGIKVENIVVIHDELESVFGKVSLKEGGSAKGHNGLRSVISACGPDFLRIRCGISRPDNREDVSKYVLTQFPKDDDVLDRMIEEAVRTLKELCDCE